MIFIVCALHLLAAQLVPAQRSKGNVIRFRRPGYKNKSSSDQEEHRPTRFAQDEGKQDGSVQDNKASQQSPIPTIARQSSVFRWNNLSYEIKTGKDRTRKILDKIDG